MTDLAGSRRIGMVPQHLLRNCTRQLARWAAQSYVAGPELADALALCRRLWANGLASTVCFWNVKGELPRSVAGHCLEALRALRTPGVEGYLSVKAPALGFDAALHEELVEAARAQDVRLHFDSHGPEDADATLALIERCARAYPKIGCTLPGRWRRSLRDADWAVERGLHVRVIKGQWDDSELPQLDARAGFQALVERLAGRGVHVAVATHDPVLARRSLQQLLAAGTSCELELLYGLPLRAAIDAARELGVRVRVYVPYGKAWLPYALSQLRQKPALFWWLARDALLGRAFKLRGS
jgi:proline dehydrogenase